MQKTAERYCFCLTRRFVAFCAAFVTLLKIAAQTTYESIIHSHLGPEKAHSQTANYSAFMIGQALQMLVTILLIVAIWKENANMMWPYLCWLSLNLLLEGFGCLILVYTNWTMLKAIMKELIVYGISLSLSITLIYFTNSYEKELRRREVKSNAICSDTDSNA